MSYRQNRGGASRACREYGPRVAPKAARLYFLVTGVDCEAITSQWPARFWNTSVQV
jgi:hypothetical protein